jgi:hypothetical protein
MILIPESALIRQGQLTGIYTIGNGNVDPEMENFGNSNRSVVRIINRRERLLPPKENCLTERRLVFSKQFSVQ